MSLHGGGERSPRPCACGNAPFSAGSDMLPLVAFAASAAASAAAPSCPKTERGVCYNPPGYRFVAADSAEACCSACSADPACASWTYIGREADGQGPCHLKNAAPVHPEDRRNGSACTSGVVRKDPTPAPPGPPHPPAPAPSPPAPPAPKGALNVLFMVIDDLRPEFNKAYGQTYLKTPNLDKFKETALTFSRAYVQYSHCSPSRNSFMSGRSPQTTSVYNFIDHFRMSGIGEDWTAMPQFFKVLIIALSSLVGHVSRSTVAVAVKVSVSSPPRLSVRCSSRFRRTMAGTRQGAVKSTTRVIRRITICRARGMSTVRLPFRLARQSTLSLSWTAAVTRLLG